ncbi:hypothetical protein JW948_18475 [bacterium]|nr:hypothetical protein [bacterium]
MSRTALKIETGIIGTALILAVAFWSTGSAGHTAESDVQYYGGKVSAGMSRKLHDLHAEIQEASCIMAAEPQRILIRNRSGESLEYRFEYRTLWRNEIPVIAGIEAFHFEYRDAGGHSMCSFDPSRNRQIRSIGFLMRSQNEDRDVFAQGRIEGFKAGDSFREPFNSQLLLAEIE